MSQDRTSSPAHSGSIHHPARVAVVYESMFGNTRRVAEAIAEGVSETATVEVSAVQRVQPWPLEPDVIIVGAPTHVHGLSRDSTRAEAVRWSEDPARHLALDASAKGTGVREWLLDGALPASMFAAFDTRADMPRIFTGSAAAAIDRQLRAHGLTRLAHPESFVVDKDNELEGGEVDRAREWGRQLGEMLAPLRAESEV
ncbi:flavodoxin domain-containing protein [Microbacterium sp. AZCO]|uniref:flavodoxin family protein n=1 Tax=Microbacterium sp. AZCO TaxID=3142976 RepID=UPI0031F3DF66